MRRVSYARHRFPPTIIQHAVWLYFRFALSYRDVEDLLSERGIDVSYETVRRWVLKFGRPYAERIRERRPRPSDRWHLDKVSLKIRGKIVYLGTVKDLSHICSRDDGSLGLIRE
jgi:putative transposase